MIKDKISKNTKIILDINNTENIISRVAAERIAKERVQRAMG